MALEMKSICEGCGKILPAEGVTPARVEHRFEDFSDDFAVWVIFYGPEGGEASIRKGGSDESRKTI